jgi:hypothetical protein
MASHGLFVGLWVNFGVSFGFSGCFRSGYIYSGVVYFFLCHYPFFCVVARRFSSVVLIAFFVVVVLGLMFSFSCTYYNILSLFNVLLLMDRVNAWCCVFLLRCFWFSCSFVLPI